MAKSSSTRQQKGNKKTVTKKAYPKPRKPSPKKITKNSQPRRQSKSKTKELQQRKPTEKISAHHPVVDHYASQPIHHIIFDNDGGKDDIVALALLIAGQVASEFPATVGVAMSYAQLNEKMNQKNCGGQTDNIWQRIQLDGITMLDGDCLLEPAADAMRRMIALGLNGNTNFNPEQRITTVPTSTFNPHSFMQTNNNRREIPVVASPLKNVGSPFPLVWRRSSMTIDFLPILNSPQVNEVLKKESPHHLSNNNNNNNDDDCENEQKPIEGHEALAQMVFACAASAGPNSNKITLLATGPLSNIAHCITQYGSRFTDLIDRIIVMGGAVDVPGNVLKIHAGSHDSATTPNAAAENKKAENLTDRSAEWNIYWDAPAAKIVLQEAAKNLLRDKIYLFSLDSTNSVPITEDIVRDFGSLNTSVFLVKQQDYSAPIQNIAPFAQIAGTCWAICPWYPKETAPKYYAWDVLCAAYLLDPSVVQFEKRSVQVVTDNKGSHPEEGKLVPQDDEEIGGGNMFVAKNVNQDLFYRILRTALQL